MHVWWTRAGKEIPGVVTPSVVNRREAGRPTEDLDLDNSARHATSVDMRTPRSYEGEVMQLHVEYSKGVLGNMYH